MSFCLNLSTDLESLSLSRWLSSHCSLHLHALLFWFFHLENKPSQRSAEMLAQFQSSHCLVLGVHLLTCSTNTLQILIKGSSAHVHSCQKFCHTYWSDASVHSVWLMVYFERSGLGWWIDFLITICIDLVLHTEKCDLTSSLSSLRRKSQAIY